MHDDEARPCIMYSALLGHIDSVTDNQYIIEMLCPEVPKYPLLILVFPRGLNGTPFESTSELVSFS